MAMGNAMGKFIKTSYWFSLTVLLCSCGQAETQQRTQQDSTGIKGDNTTKKIQTMVRKFDIERFEKNMIADPFYDGRKLEDGTYVQEYFIPRPNIDIEPFSRAAAEFFVERIENKNGFEELITYYNNGEIKEYKKFFSRELEVGIWKYYNQDGSLIKTIDKDLGYKFNLDDVIKFGKRNAVDFHQDGDLKRGFSERFKKNIWTVSWIEDFPGKDSIEHYCIIDATSGDVLERQKRPAPIRKASR